MKRALIHCQLRLPRSRRSPSTGTTRWARTRRGRGHGRYRRATLSRLRVHSARAVDGSLRSEHRVAETHYRS